MACRIQNMGKHPLGLELRGGEIVYLNPHEVSRPLREEALYTNRDLPQWLASGLVRQLEASMSEVLKCEGTAPPEADVGTPDDGAPDAAADEGAAASAGGKSAGGKKGGSKGAQKNAS